MLWDKMVKECDGEDSGERVEISQPTKNSKDMVHARSKTLYSTRATETGEEDAVPMEAKEFITSVEITRGRGAEYAKDGILFEDFDQRMQTTFKKLTWKEFEGRGLFIAGAEDDPCAHL